MGLENGPGIELSDHLIQWIVFVNDLPIRRRIFVISFGPGLDIRRLNEMFIVPGSRYRKPCDIRPAVRIVLIQGNEIFQGWCIVNIYIFQGGSESIEKLFFPVTDITARRIVNRRINIIRFIRGYRCRSSSVPPALPLGRESERFRRSPDSDRFGPSMQIRRGRIVEGCGKDLEGPAKNRSENKKYLFHNHHSLFSCN